jgi:hypothetical protein
MGEAQRGSLASASRATLESIAMSDNPITSPDAPEAVKRYFAHEAIVMGGRIQTVVLATDFDRVVAERDAMEKERDGLRERMERIQQWCDAYPLDVFPEPDFARVQTVLMDAGLSLGAVSASNMRHVLNGVRALAAMGDKPCS